MGKREATRQRMYVVEFQHSTGWIPLDGHRAFSEAHKSKREWARRTNLRWAVRVRKYVLEAKSGRRHE